MPVAWNVALLVGTARSYGRGLLGGIANYARGNGRWMFHLVPGDFAQSLPSRDVWDGDGIIAWIQTPALARQLVRRKLPVVVLNRRYASSQWPGIGGNQRLACRMAAEHFLARGFQRFAYCGVGRMEYAREREADFRQRLTEAGFAPEVFWHGAVAQDDRSERKRLVEWLVKLPKPVGLLASEDVFARQVLDACRLASVAVPEEVAVLGIDNDEPVCDLAEPPLSSVAFNSARIGYEAAAMLNRLLSGEPAKQVWTEIDPLGVAIRKSCDRLAIEDPEVAAAVRFIREHAADAIHVEDVVAAVSLSRRSLELRFQRALGRSPLEEINSVHVERAKELLVRTEYKLSRVALSCGFSSDVYLHSVFRRHTGMTPLAFRRHTRGTGR